MNNFALSLLLLGALSTGAQLPFWVGANQYGLMPEGSGGLALFRAGTEYDATKEFQWKWGVSLAGQYDSRDVPEKTADFSAMVDELYASARWKALRLDAGLKHVDIDFLGAGMPSLGSMSTTGGHIIWSGNARTMPGYLITLDPVAVPFTHQVLWIHGAFGDYKTLDNRYVKGALIHSTKIFLLLKIHPRLNFQLGLDHYAIWGGTSPDYGKMPVTFDNYLRVITGRKASSSGTINDQENVIGDQGGGLLCCIDWHDNGWALKVQRDVPYNDGSGMAGIQNWPDGVYTLWFGFDRKERWVSDILYEYQYTMKQSGTWHDRPTTPEERARLDPNDPYHYYHHIYGGIDNYFHNGEYRSCWTYFGRIIGNPLFLPEGAHDCTWTSHQTVLGVENNRIKAHHFSIAGKAFHKLPYKLMLTYSQNYGTYDFPYLGESQKDKPWGTVKETPLHQVSAAFVGEVPFYRHFTLTYGLFADRGQLLPDTFGATLGLRWDL